jgi:hypothetical protein
MGHLDLRPAAGCRPSSAGDWSGSGRPIRSRAWRVRALFALQPTMLNGSAGGHFALGGHFLI